MIGMGTESKDLGGPALPLQFPMSRATTAIGSEWIQRPFNLMWTNYQEDEHELFL